MPGIAGIISKISGRNPHRAELASMIAAMMHEPFYTSGVYSDDNLNIRVGWVHQENPLYRSVPVVDKQRQVVVVFHGEDFSRNPMECGSESGNRDAYLIRRFEQSGESFLAQLNGSFAGVLLDLNARKVLLFNDRYGMQRIYYHETSDAFYFSSEAKSLLRVVPSLREINPEALAENVGFGFVTGEKSLFRGVSVLPGGSCWSFGGHGRSRRTLYFTPATLESKPQLSENHLVERLQSLVVDILPKYLQSPEPVALSLTGGLDTRLIVAGAKRLEGHQSYTFAGNRDTFDVRQSSKVARAGGFSHHVIRLGTDFFQDFQKLAEGAVYITDGLLGAGNAHNLYLNRLARGFAPVRLTGVFGSEVLRQGRILPPAARVRGLFEKDLLKQVADVEQRIAPYRHGNPLTAALHRDFPWRIRPILSIEESQVILRSPFMDNALVELMYAVPNEVRQSKKLQQEMIRRLNPQLGRILSDRGFATGRSPVIISFAQLILWGLFKADYLHFFETPNWFMKIESVMNSLKLSPLVFGYHKFENYRSWYSGILSDYVADTLLDPKSLQRSLFERDFLRKVVNDHVAGKANYCNELNQALTYELTMRTLIDSTAYPPVEAGETESIAVSHADEPKPNRA